LIYNRGTAQAWQAPCLCSGAPHKACHAACVAMDKSVGTEMITELSWLVERRAVASVAPCPVRNGAATELSVRRAKRIPMYIGSVVGGPEISSRSSLLQEAKRLVEIISPIRPEEGSTSVIDLVLFVPGPILKPDWTGARTGSLSKKLKLLQIQVAVP